MTRLSRSLSGRQIYGQKWKNKTESDDGRLSESTETTNVSVPAPPCTGPADDENQTRKGNIRSCRESMYRAALVGDWLAAEMLLQQHPTLLWDEITERGDRALHVAVAMEHTQLVRNLVDRMSASDLENLQDGHGYTASCYAAISGAVETARLLLKKTTNLARDKNGETPLHKAASRGDAKMFLCFLESTKVDDLLEGEWFNLLLLTIRRRMYDVALKILQMNIRIATMRNEEGTALHMLARNRKPIINSWHRYRMKSHHRLLAEKLWAEIQNLGHDSVLELMKNPPILHDAARTRNVALITMITQDYPDLIWHTDNDGYTIFHIAAIYKHDFLFSLIDQIGAMKDFIAISQDKDGNNILHLTGKLAIRNEYKAGGLMMASGMKKEIQWFKKVVKMVPPSCSEMKNKDGLTPAAVFTKEHRVPMQECETWLRNTSDSCMLTSTIMLTVVFASAFTVPGGYNGQTGIPILISKTFWFNYFVISEAVALASSISSILFFLLVMRNTLTERRFLYILKLLERGMLVLQLSLVGTISAFFSLYFLVFVDKTTWVVKTVIICAYVVLLAQSTDVGTYVLFLEKVPDLGITLY